MWELVDLIILLISGQMPIAVCDSLSPCGGNRHSVGWLCRELSYGIPIAQPRYVSFLSHIREGY